VQGESADWRDVVPDREHTMTREYVIVLNVLVDEDKTWWQALGLPDPATWALSDTFRDSVFPTIESEHEVQRARVA